MSGTLKVTTNSNPEVVFCTWNEVHVFIETTWTLFIRAGRAGLSISSKAELGLNLILEEPGISRNLAEVISL